MEHEKAAERANKLMKETTDLLSEFDKTDTNDPEAVLQLARKHRRLAQEFESLIQEQTADFRAMLDLTGVHDESERSAQLVRAFEFGAKLNGFFLQEVPDINEANAVSDELGKVYCRLEEAGRQAALMPLLDNSNPYVRLNVAGPLLRTAGRDRAVAALRELASDKYGPDVKSSAWTVLLMEGEETLEPEMSG